MTQLTAWQPPRPIGTRWQRFTDSVRLLVSVVRFVGGGRTVNPTGNGQFAAYNLTITISTPSS